MKALIDTNVVLDLLLNREPFLQNAKTLFRKIESKTLQGFVSATTITDIYYLSKKHFTHAQTIEMLRDLMQIIEVATVHKYTIFEAIQTPLTDFEDAVQIAVAKQYAIDTIITRNTADFSACNLSIFTPQQMIDFLNSNS